MVRAVSLPLQAQPSGMDVHRWDLMAPLPNLGPSCVLQLKLCLSWSSCLSLAPVPS